MKKEAMIQGDWAEARLAKRKSPHPSTSSGRTDLQYYGKKRTSIR